MNSRIENENISREPQSETEKTLIERIKEHKGKIILAIAIGAGIAASIIFYNKSKENGIPTTERTWEFSPSEPDKAINCENIKLGTAKVIEITEHLRKQHIRNLPDGWEASPEKKATAIENGIELAEHQTWVEKCICNKAIA